MHLPEIDIKHGYKSIFIMVKQVAVAVLVVSSVVNADVSHLAASKGYQYANLGLTSTLQLHSPDYPAPTQFLSSSYGDGSVSSSLPSSYAAPPSGSPFGSAAPLPVSYPSQRLSVPLQSPVYAPQKLQTQPTFQQARSYQPQTYQQQSYQNLAYQAPAYQAPAYQTPTYQQPARAVPSYNAYTSGQVQAQTQSVQSQQPIITKHFYVHAAPEDPEEKATGPRFVQIGRARKNYKIIFIKPPTYDLTSQIIPVIPPTEEKTIVYVLSKKPTLDQNIQLPEPAPTEPSKPDVFFIKYKTQQEADEAQQSIQGNFFKNHLTPNYVISTSNCNICKRVKGMWTDSVT